MYKRSFFFLFVLYSAVTNAQSVNSLIQEGNKQYANQDYGAAETAYKKAVAQDAKSYTANYNLAATLFKQNKFADAATTFSNAKKLAQSNIDRANVLYNEATALARNDKLEEAIEKYKEALKENEKDEDCRYNLTKALRELQKKKQQQKSSSNPKPDKNKQEQPKQNPSKYNAQQIEQVLQMLRRKEQEVQKRLKKQQKPGLKKPEKDW